MGVYNQLFLQNDTWLQLVVGMLRQFFWRNDKVIETPFKQQARNLLTISRWLAGLLKAKCTRSSLQRVLVSNRPNAVSLSLTHTHKHKPYTALSFKWVALMEPKSPKELAVPPHPPSHARSAISFLHIYTYLHTTFPITLPILSPLNLNFIVSVLFGWYKDGV